MTKKVFLFPNGLTAVFDEQDQQMPHLQRSWIYIFVDFLEEHDEDPAEFEFIMPNGTRMKVFENENGWYGEVLR